MGLKLILLIHEGDKESVDSGAVARTSQPVDGRARITAGCQMEPNNLTPTPPVTGPKPVRPI